MIAQLFRTLLTGAAGLLLGIYVGKKAGEPHQDTTPKETTIGDEVQATTFRVQRRNTELINEAQRLQLSLYAAQTERDNLRMALQKKEAELEEMKASLPRPYRPNGTLAAF